MINLKSIKYSEWLTTISLIAIIVSSIIIYSFKLGVITSQFNSISQQIKVVQENKVDISYIDDKFNNIDKLIQTKVDYHLYKTEMDQLKQELRNNREDHIKINEKLDLIILKMGEKNVNKY